MRVRLALGADPEQAIQGLQQLIGGMETAIRPDSRDTVSLQRDYIQWATEAERQLEAILNRRDVMALFNTPRHLAVCSMSPTAPLTPLVYAELDVLKHELKETLELLESRRKRMQAAPGLPIVVDTNVLLQCQRLDQVDWAAVVSETARVMVPLRVIEEIEEKKYSDSKRLRRRARNLLPWIDKQFTVDSPGPQRLTDGATIEMVLVERPRYRPASADDEILEVACDIRQFTGRTKLLTADTSMRSRARAESLDVLDLPDSWKLRQDDD